MNPLLTIIIPTYNSENTVKNAIDSILSQTFKEYEILIIDNQSRDETIPLVQQYMLNYNSVRYISEKDNGIYDAMNKGISLAKGEWVYFLGSDDRLFGKDTIEEIFSNKDNLLVQVLYGNVSRPGHEKYDGEFDPEKLYGQNICHQAIFFKKSLFEITGKFTIKYKSAADWEHNIKWFLNPGIKKKYMDVIVAYHAAGGFSYLYKDEAFKQDKEKLFLKYGRGMIPAGLKTALLKIVAYKAYANREYLNMIPYLTKYFICKFKLKIKNDSKTTK